MARATFSLLLLFLSLLYFSGTAESAFVTSINFIKSSCSVTRYPELCVQSLSNYASTIQKSPRQLARTALNVSLTQAEKTRKFVRNLGKFKGLKRREYGAIRDCLEEIGDSVDRLGESIGELKHMGKAHGPDFLWHMSNVQTWVSAALTDESTCLDGFAGRALDGRVKAWVRAWVTHVAQVTSNALALVNQLAT